MVKPLPRFGLQLAYQGEVAFSVLRDEGEAYARKLREADVDVTAARYEGILHDFVMLNHLAAPTRPPRRSIKRSVTCDGKLFS